MENKEYNGWRNYETWMVSLHITNEEGTSDGLRKMCEDALQEAEGDKDAAAQTVSDCLPDTVREWFLSEEEQRSIEKNLFLADIFQTVWGEVDWVEIAENALSDLNWVDENEAYEAGKARGERFTQFNQTREDAYEAEQTDRDFSPFEHTAHKLNDCVNSETAWEKFDEGISDAISSLPSEDDETEEN